MKFLLIALIVFFLGCSKEIPTNFQATKVPEPAQVTGELFTPAELKFISEKRVIRVGVDSNYPPFIFYNMQGQMVGLSKEYMDAVAKVSGLKFSIQRISQRDELISAIKNGELDMLTSAKSSPDRTAFMLFSQPYVHAKGVFVLRDGVDVKSMRTVGVGRGYAASTYMRLTFPDIERREQPSDEISMLLLRDGELDGALMSEEAASYFQNKLGLKFNKAPSGYVYDLGFAFGKTGRDVELLSSIVVKSLEALPITTKNEINQRWLSFPPPVLKSTDGKVIPQ